MAKTHSRGPKVPVKRLNIDKVEQDWNTYFGNEDQDGLQPKVSTPQHYSCQDQTKPNAARDTQHQSFEQQRYQAMKQRFNVNQAWVRQQHERMEQLDREQQQKAKARQPHNSKEPLPLPPNSNKQQNPSQQIRKPSRCLDFTKPQPWNYEFRAREHESFEEWCERAIAQFQRGLPSVIKTPMSIEDRAKLRGITLPEKERIGCEIPWSYDEDRDNTAEKVGQRESNNRKRRLSPDNSREESSEKRVQSSTEECSFDDLLSSYKTEQQIRILGIKRARW